MQACPFPMQQAMKKTFAAVLMVYDANCLYADFPLSGAPKIKRDTAIPGSILTTPSNLL